MFRRRQDEVAAVEVEGITPRRPHAGLLRREQKVLLRAREAKLRDLGGLVVEMYRRGASARICSRSAARSVIGIDARLAEIDDASPRRGATDRCECGAPMLRGSHFCPNCGRVLDGAAQARERHRVSQSRSSSRKREAAIAAVERTCPRCGTPRSRDQDYCVECGLRLPAVRAGVASLRRGWIRRFGWYPGDWIWVGLPTLLVAMPGAAVAIALHRRQPDDGRHHDRRFDQPPAPPRDPARRRRAPPSLPDRARADRDGRNLDHRVGRRARRRTAASRWPATRDGWTIVLVSYPVARGRTPAVADRRAAPRASGLPEVGVLDSSDFSSLHPGYFVVFSGVYSSPADAERRSRPRAREVSELPIRGKSPVD